MIINTFKRYEKKYILNENQLKQLIKIVKIYMNPDKYCLNGKRYKIYNIYYDTDNNDIIRHSLSKPYYKEKLRLRSYYPICNEDDKVFLELKKKIGGIVSKRRATMMLSSAKDFIEKGIFPETDNYFDNQVLKEISFFLKNNKVNPKTFISYDRQAFFGKEDSNFRLTFDDNIQSRRYDLFSENRQNVSLLENGKYIMEIKIIGSIPMWLAKAISDLNIRKVSFSKYGTEYKRHITKVNKKVIYAIYNVKKETVNQ